MIGLYEILTFYLQQDGRWQCKLNIYHQGLVGTTQKQNN